MKQDRRLAWQFCLALALFCVGALSVIADEAAPAAGLPKWELGIGALALGLADYPGADESSAYLLPLPTVIYRGDLLRSDRDGLRGLLFDRDWLEVNVSAGGSLPVNSDDNRAREGMDDLGPSFEIGPSLRVKLIDGDTARLQLRLNSRALIAVEDFPGLSREGWIVSPELHWQYRPNDSVLLRLSLAARYADATYHDYFLGVAPRFARPDRPRYEGEAGFGGIAFNSGLSLALNPDWRLYAGAGYLDLSSVAFDDSPLFRQDYAIYGYFSVSYTLWRSAARGVQD